MNLFIGVIMNSMDESQKELSDELRKINYKDKNDEELFKHLISKLDELRDEIQSLKKNTGKTQ
jgi:F0F1-type ATP synthase membrane subunit b/b'